MFSYSRRKIGSSSRRSPGRKTIPRRQALDLSGLPRQPRGTLAVDHVVRFVRNAGYSAIQTSGSAVFGALTFALTDLPAYTDISNAFDFYRIDRICLRFMPCQTVIPTTCVTGPIATAIDLNDNSVPATVNQLRQYETYECHRVCQEFCINLSPKCQMQIYDGSFTAYGEAPKNQWINCSNPDVPHYCVKYGVNSATLLPSPGLLTWNLEATFWISAKNMR